MRDYNAYLKGMEKSMAEKLFFLPYLEKVENEVVYLIDFGCASGEMLSRIPDMPDMQKIGIDHDSNMLQIARTKTNGTFYSSLDEFVEKENPCEKTCAIVFSSVLHEVGNEYEEIKEFVKKYCSYVFIRDMFISVGEAGGYFSAGWLAVSLPHILWCQHVDWLWRASRSYGALAGSSGQCGGDVNPAVYPDVL